ncbi:hypothetical protein HWV62_29330 [Athelia sp. TMB]|nr:hypothetical protein HWV62_29330 [Athelia sp. TMB]
METIPFFDIHRVTARIRGDGRFGYQDFTLCPQVYSSRYVHRALIPSKKALENTRESCMWWTPTEPNFVPLKNSLFPDLGRLRATQLEDMDDLSEIVKRRAYAIMQCRSADDVFDLERAVTNMRHGIMRLRYSPYTYKEMVLDLAQTQRCYLDAKSLCDYHETSWKYRFALLGPASRHANSDLLGAWTTDAAAVQRLFHAGVPVYYVRPKASMRGTERVLTLQDTARPNTSIVTCDWSHNGVVTVFPARYSGEPTDDLHVALSLENRYRDLEVYFMDLDRDRFLAPVGVRGQVRRVTKAKNGQVRGRQPSMPRTMLPPRDKWLDMEGDLIPSTLETWSTALLSLDRTVRSATAPPKSVSGYRFPDPGMSVRLPSAKFAMMLRRREVALSA